MNNNEDIVSIDEERIALVFSKKEIGALKDFLNCGFYNEPAACVDDENLKIILELRARFNPLGVRTWKNNLNQETVKNGKCKKILSESI